MHYYLKLLILLALVGCSTPRVRSPQPTAKPEINYNEKRGLNIENCMHRLLQKGVHQQLIYPICGQIYSEPQLLQQDNSGFRAL